MHSKNQRRHGSPVVPMSNKAPLAHSAINPSQPGPFRVPRDGVHSPFSRAPHAVYPPKGARGRPCVSVPVVSLEKIPCLGRSEGAHVRLNCTSTTSSSSSSSTSSTAAMLKPSHKPQDRVPNGKIPSVPPSALDRRPSASPSTLDRRPSSSPSPSPSPSSLDRRPSAPPTALDKKHQNGTKGNKPYKRTSVRVFDPNKHCGVLDPESRRACTRSLTCKTHSLTHRRAVPGRKKQFDSLLAEHKGRIKEKEKEKEAQPVREQQRARDSSHILPAQSHDPLSSTPTNCRDSKTLSPSKARPLGAFIPRTPGSKGGFSQNCCPGPAPDMVPLSLGAEGGDRLSSDDDEVAVPGESERPDCHCSPRHPRPMGCCSFGSRLMGQGHYVFDRRWDRTRLALHRMVEKHVNSLMWRKIPLADESPTPSPGAIPATQSFLSPSPSSSFGISPPLLSPPAAFVGPSDGVSMTSYSATFPHGSGGVFSIMDTSSLVPLFPALSAVSSQGARPRAKPSKPPKAHDQASAALGVTAGGTMGGALGGAEGGAVRGRKKKPPLSCPAAHKRNSITAVPPLNPHPAGPAFCSNGTPAHCAKTEPSPHAGDFAAPHPLPGDHTLSVHSPLPFSPACGRKRKSSSPSGSPRKMTKTSGLSSILKKGVSGPEPPHTILPRQPAVHR